jgi:hydroxymethylpyrimidine/phosphomethylpyrimidine kinase
VLIETVADFLETHPVPLVVDPVMVASSGAELLEDDAVGVLGRRPHGGSWTRRA